MTNKTHGHWLEFQNYSIIVDGNMIIQRKTIAILLLLFVAFAALDWLLLANGLWWVSMALSVPPVVYLLYRGVLIKQCAWCKTIMGVELGAWGIITQGKCEKCLKKARLIKLGRLPGQEAAEFLKDRAKRMEKCHEAMRAAEGNSKDF